MPESRLRKPGYRHTYPGGQSFGGVTDEASGPFTSTTPGPTSGRAITLPAGVLRATVSATGYTTNGAVGLSLQVFLDGAQVASLTLPPSLTANAHLALRSASFTAAVTAGTHYWALKVIGGTYDSSDSASLFAIVLPA